MVTVGSRVVLAGFLPGASGPGTASGAVVESRLYATWVLRLRPAGDRVFAIERSGLASAPRAGPEKKKGRRALDTPTHHIIFVLYALFPSAVKEKILRRTFLAPARIGDSSNREAALGNVPA